MSEHPVELSTRIIDSGTLDGPVNRMTEELSELGDGVAIVESFSHAILVDTGDGLVVFDASGIATGGPVVEAIRSWRTDPVGSAAYEITARAGTLVNSAIFCRSSSGNGRSPRHIRISG